MDELQNKREMKFKKENKYNLLEMLYFVANKEKVKASQETFEVNSIQKFRRMEELIHEMYSDSTLILQSFPEYGEATISYLTVLKVIDKKKLPNILNVLLNEHLGENYTLTEELLINPTSLSFSNGKEKLYLISYDGATVEV